MKLTKKRAIWILVSVVACIVLILVVHRELKIDSCLDKGGRWDYEAGKCDP